MRPCSRHDDVVQHSCLSARTVLLPASIQNVHWTLEKGAARMGQQILLNALLVPERLVRICHALGQ